MSCKGRSISFWKRIGTGRCKVMLPLFLAVSCCASAVHADSDPYVAFKGGAFLPNGKTTSITSDSGFSSFGSGHNFEIAAGVRPESYAAIELGVGYYGTDSSVSSLTTNLATSYKAYAVPITLTAKGILPLGRLECFAGAGLGYWLGQLRYKQQRLDTGAVTVERTVNASAPGYQLVAGADFRLTQSIDLGGEAKWFSVKPEFDFTDASGKKVKWEFGGTVVNLVVKYRF